MKRKFLLWIQQFYTPLAWLVSGRAAKRLWSRLDGGSFPRPFDEFCGYRFRGRETVRAVEVGVFRGNHAASMCRYIRPGVLFAVDGYQAWNEWEHLGPLLESARTSARRRLQKHRVIFIEQNCLDVVFPLLDCVYIDAAHDLESVRKHIRHWWPMVQPGGVMGGHDFEHKTDAVNDGEVPYGVVQAVLEFVIEHKLKLYTSGTDWWVVKPNIKAER